jgi:hypothetical protein
MAKTIVEDIFDSVGDHDIDDYADLLQALLDARADRDIILAAAFKAGAVTILTTLAELKGELILEELQEFLEDELRLDELEDA